MTIAVAGKGVLLPPRNNRFASLTCGFAAGTTPAAAPDGKPHPVQVRAASRFCRRDIPYSRVIKDRAWNTSVLSQKFVGKLS